MKVAIVGPGADKKCYYDSSWTIWGINAAYRNLPDWRWSAMFNLHRYDHLERDVPQYLTWDAVFSRLNPTVPIYVIDDWHGLLERQVIFPRKAIDAAFPRCYHASSFDWLVAFAILRKAKIIHIHGARFALDGPGDEPISAHACLEYWCGLAEGRGIKVSPMPSSEMFRQYHLVRSNSVYGYDDVHMVENRP